MNTFYLVPFFLGTFSGFLTTLPIGPAKILAVRKFLLISKGTQLNEERSYLSLSNTILLSSICGLIFAQILFFLALQFPFLYSLWVKPHFFSFFFVFILFVYLYQIKNIQIDIYNNQFLLKSESNFSYQQAAFLETLLLQLLNPVVLPNPVFCRLTHVFLFRYSTISTFFAGNFVGLLSGYGMFFLSTLFLLKKLEEDAPTIYRLVKIKIHQFFGIVLVIFSFICLSRTSLPAIKPFTLNAGAPTTFSLKNFWNVGDFWPDSFFGYDRWKRPLRLIAFENEKSQPDDELNTFENKKSQPDDQSAAPFNKMFFSQFFFEGALAKDGNYRLYHNFSQSLSLISQNLNSILNIVLKDSQIESVDKYQNQNLMDDWIQEKKNRHNQIKKNINTKINHIEKGVYLEELVQKKFSSLDNNQNKISKQLDPRLNSDLRGTKFFVKNKKDFFLTKDYFTNKDSLVEPIEKKNLTDKYTKNKLKLFFIKNSQVAGAPFSPTTRESIFKPFLTWLAEIQSSSDQNKTLKEISLDTSNLVKKKSDLDGPTGPSGASAYNTKMATIYKPMPLWNINFNKKELNRLKETHLNIFFSKSSHLADRQNFVAPLMPFFRRNEFPGTITSRRGKAVCWNTFQKKPYSPLFVNHLNLLKNFFSKRKKIQNLADLNGPTRSWQPTSRLFQFLRDYLLSLQAYIRKYFKLPILIIIKNFGRQLFLQPAEWEKDWTNLSKEVYVQCDFYGKADSIGVKLPKFFSKEEPKQIKIINPFQLRFWTRSFSEKSSLEESENYSFLNVWGRETKMPFGKVKKSPSFWKLLIERIKLIIHYKIQKKLSVSGDPSYSATIEKQIDVRKDQSKYEVQHQLEFEKSKFDLTKREDSPGLVRQHFQNNSIENKLKYKTAKRKILNNSTKTKTLSHFTKKEKINRKRHYTLKNIVILLQKQWFHFYRFFLKKQRELIFHIQKNFFEIETLIQSPLGSTRIIKICTKLFYNISRFLRSFCYQIYDIVKVLLLKLTKSPKQLSSHIIASTPAGPTKNLSQAYILHSIWEDRMMSRPNITSLMKSWNQNLLLKNNLEDFLNEQGILGTEKPENLTEYQWQEWLKNFRGYTPSVKLWALWAPNYWTQAVEQYWKELPTWKLKSILTDQEQEANTIDQNLNFNTTLDNNILNNFLEPHLPLFQAAQKQKKLWKFHILYQNYLEINHDGDVESFYNWKTNDFEKKTHYLFDTIKKVKAKDKNPGGPDGPLNLSSLPQLKENKLRQNVTQQNISIPDGPLIQREKKRFDFDIKLQTLQQRASKEPVSTRRWKLKKLKNKLEKLAKTVIKKPQGASAYASTLTISEKNKKQIQELFESENKLFANILENWNSKILDDEVLMYNTVSSILRFGNKNINAFPLNSSDSLSLFPRNMMKPLDLNFLLLEDIFLPTYLREIRILDYFDFEKANYADAFSKSNVLQSNNVEKKKVSNKKEKNIYAETISKWLFMLQQKQTSMKDRQTILRFLWPTHRLEDLSCINRFWMGTANQSRFSMLRIHSFAPNV